MQGGWRRPQDIETIIASKNSQWMLLAITIIVCQNSQWMFLAITILSNQLKSFISLSASTFYSNWSSFNLLQGNWYFFEIAEFLNSLQDFIVLSEFSASKAVAPIGLARTKFCPAQALVNRLTVHNTPLLSCKF